MGDTLDSVDPFRMFQNPVNLTGQAILETSGLLNTIWLHGEFMPEHSGAGVSNCQATNYSEQSHHAPTPIRTGQSSKLTATGDFSVFPIPIMEVPPPFTHMNTLEDLLNDYRPNLTAPLQPSIPQDTLGLSTFCMPSTAIPRDMSLNSRQEYIILPNRSMSVSLENQPAALFPAPQNLPLNLLSQTVPETREPFTVPPACRTHHHPIFDTSMLPPFNPNAQGLISSSLIQKCMNGSQCQETNSRKRKNDEHLYNMGKVPKGRGGLNRRKGPSGVPASCLTTFSVVGTQTGPRKKTNNSCLRCIWARKGVCI